MIIAMSIMFAFAAVTSVIIGLKTLNEMDGRIIKAELEMEHMERAYRTGIKPE